MRESSVLGQLLKLTPRRDFEILAKQHHVGQALRKTSRWDQYVALLHAQITGQSSLRDIDQGGQAQQRHLARVGCKPVNRSTLSRVNSMQSSDLFQALFQNLLARCQGFAGHRKLPVNRKLVSIDSTTIMLSLELCPWAPYRHKKAAVKVHVGLDHSSLLPGFVCITEGCTHDHQIVNRIALEKGTVYVFDRGYYDFAWYKRIADAGGAWVTRSKLNLRYIVIRDRTTSESKGVLADQQIRLSGEMGKKNTRILRRIQYKDPTTGKDLVFITNQLTWSALTIAAVYKERWQIELFFKWMKQHAKIKHFIGTSSNAVLTQIWIALITYLMMAFLKLSGKLALSLTEIHRFIRATIFDLINLLRAISHPWAPPPKLPQNQLELVLQ